jgi:MFS family permease
VSTISTVLGSATPGRSTSDNYKWIALINMTLGTLMATIDASITLIAMPDIFRGIHLDPLASGNSFYLLWMLLGFLIITSVLVLNFGRLGDIYGRVRLYNMGFVIYTVSSLFLAIVWLSGKDAATYLIVMRIVQGIGSALILANAGAIITDAFPPGERGTALGINNIAALSGQFIGLVLGGVLAPIDWRLVFLISVPPGVIGTAWAYWKLEERSVRQPGKIDWLGNLTFGVGLVAVMIGITYGIEPYGAETMGWESPRVIGFLTGGVVCLALFTWIETRVESPMFALSLFKIRAFTFGSISTLLSGIARGGLMFMLIIWLQGIWLPTHGISFEKTPLWAGIYMLPLTFGFLISGPISGRLSDRYGQRQFATGGMIASAACFLVFLTLPVDFSFPEFATLLAIFGIANGMFFAPNRAAVMNSLPPEHRGSGNGMNSTFQNSAQVLSIGIFFTLMIIGLSSSLPASLTAGLSGQGIPAATVSHIAHLPPISVLFAAFLGYNPMAHLIGPGVLSHLTPAHASMITGRKFFPSLISAPFHKGLHEAFTFAAVVCLIAGLMSWSRGKTVKVPVPEGDEEIAVAHFAE